MDEAAGNQGFQRHPTSTSGMQVPIASDGVFHANLNEVATGGETEAGGGGNNNAANQCLVREQDRFMPIANVIRIMRKVLPTHAKISDDAKETIQECVSEYISFITSEANERCQKEQRKTITAEDVLWAMSKLGFDDYVEPLTMYLQRYRELEGDHRGSIRGEPLAPLKRTASAVDASAAGLYGAAVQTQFHMQALAAYPHTYGVYGDGYYLSMYGSGDGSGSGSGSSSSQTTPMMHNFDPYAPFK